MSLTDITQQKTPHLGEFFRIFQNNKSKKLILLKCMFKKQSPKFIHVIQNQKNKIIFTPFKILTKSNISFIIHRSIKFNLSRCGAVGSALVLGEVTSASGGWYSEQNEAQRSKFVRAPSGKQILGTARGLPKLTFGDIFNLQKQLNTEVWRSW